MRGREGEEKTLRDSCTRLGFGTSGLGLAGEDLGKSSFLGGEGWQGCGEGGVFAPLFIYTLKIPDSMCGFSCRIISQVSISATILRLFKPFSPDLQMHHQHFIPLEKATSLCGYSVYCILLSWGPLEAPSPISPHRNHRSKYLMPCLMFMSLITDSCQDTLASSYPQGEVVTFS